MCVCVWRSWCEPAVWCLCDISGKYSNLFALPASFRHCRHAEMSKWIAVSMYRMRQRFRPDRRANTKWRPWIKWMAKYSKSWIYYFRFNVLQFREFGKMFWTCLLFREGERTSASEKKVSKRRTEEWENIIDFIVKLISSILQHDRPTGNCVGCSLCVQ